MRRVLYIESTDRVGEVILFCVLEPELNEASWTRKVAKIHDLPILVDNMHN